MKNVVLLTVVCAGVVSAASARTVRVSTDFGYDPTDSTAILQKAFDSGAETVVVDRVSGPWITRPLRGREADFIFKTHPVKWGFDFPEPGHVRGIAVRNVAYMFGKGRFRAFVGEWEIILSKT